MIKGVDLDRVFRTNIFLSKHVVSRMEPSVCIINTSSVNAAYKGNKSLLDYTTTKGAIVAFVLALQQSMRLLRDDYTTRPRLKCFYYLTAGGIIVNGYIIDI